MIRINAKLFAAVAVAKRNDLKKRVELSGVHIVNHMLKGVLIIATNGEIITVAHDEIGETNLDGTTFSVSDKTIQSIKKMKNDGVVIFEQDKLTVYDKTKDIIIYEEQSTPINVPFPDWRQVIPDFSRPTVETSISYSAYVFKKVLDTCAVFGDKTMFAAYPHDGGKMQERVLVRYAGHDNIFSIVMPTGHHDRPKPEIPFMIL